MITIIYESPVNMTSSKRAGEMTKIFLSRLLRYFNKSNALLIPVAVPNKHRNFQFLCHFGQSIVITLSRETAIPYLHLHAENQK